MTLGWIEVDGAPLGERVGFEDGASVALDAHGIRVIEDRRLAEASWRQVLGAETVPTVQGPVSYVLVPRRPPKPPWFRITAEMLPPDLRAAGLDALEHLVDARSREQGYRDAARVTPRLSSEELLALVRARREIPGALEVPVAAETRARAALEAIAEATRSLRRRLRLGGRPSPPRAVVLAPDGLVVALDGRMQALQWSEVARFGIETAPDGVRSLVVLDRYGLTLVRTPEERFDVPLRLIVAVGKQYAERIRRIRMIGPDPGP